jgi:hypothetical protein
MVAVHLGRTVMTGVAAEMVFSVLETDREEWPGFGPFGTGSPPAAVPLDHGAALVVAGDVPAPAATLAVPPMLMLRGEVMRRQGVSAARR